MSNKYPKYLPHILPNGHVKNVMLSSAERANYNFRQRSISGTVIDGYFVPSDPKDAQILKNWEPATNRHFSKEITMPAVSTKPKPTSSKPITSYSNPNEIRMKAPKPEPETVYERIKELNATPVYVEFPDGSTLKFRYTSLIDANRGVVETSIDGRAIDIRGYLTEKGFQPDPDRMKDYRLLYKKKSKSSENRSNA